MGAGRREQKNTIVLTPTIVFLGFSSVTQRQMSNRSIRTQHSFPTQTGLTARKHDRATFEPPGEDTDSRRVSLFSRLAGRGNSWGLHHVLDTEHDGARAHPLV